VRGRHRIFGVEAPDFSPGKECFSAPGGLSVTIMRFSAGGPRESAVAISRGYSYRKATTGSTRMALRAGVQLELGPQRRAHAVVAETIETQGDHLALIDSQGGLAALFLVELVESWNVLLRLARFG